MSLPSLLQLPTLMRSNKWAEVLLQIHLVAPHLAHPPCATHALSLVAREQLKSDLLMLRRGPGLTTR